MMNAEAEQETLSNIRSNALDDIEDAKTVSELNQILDDALQNIEQVPTDADLNKDDAVNKKINSTLSDVEDYKQDVDKLKADINAADFISEEDKTAAINDLNNYFQDVNSKCDSLKNLLAEPQQKKKKSCWLNLKKA